MRRSVGKQRGSRRAPRIRGGPGRTIAAFCTGFLLVFSLGAATAAAASPSTPARVLTHGDGYDSGQGSREAQEFARELRAFFEGFRDRLRHSESAQGTPPPQMTSTPPTTAPRTPTTTPSTPPTTRPAPVPSTTPPGVGGSPGPATPGPAGANAAATATVVPGVPARVAAAGSATPRGAGEAGAPASGSPPQVTFPFPGPGGHGAVIRALRSAGSYGLLFVLLGAVLVFLAVQGRVDRRDPRIARAPVDAHLDFRDLE